MAKPILYVFPLTTKKEVYPLYARVQIGSIRSNQFTLSVKIQQTEWDKENRGTTNKTVQQYINKIAKQLELLYKKYYSEKEVTQELIETLKEALLTVLKGHSPKKKVSKPKKTLITLHQAIEQYIIVINSQRVTQSTKDNKVRCISRLKKFINPQLPINEVNSEVLLVLFDKMAADGYAHNTIHSSLVILQQLFEHYVSIELINNNPIKKFNTIYKTMDTPEHIDYLTIEELAKLEKAYPTLTKVQQTALDLFFFQYETGLAYADTQTFDYDKHTIKHEERTFIVKVRHKNRNRRKKTYQKSLITKKAMEILNKYNKQLPEIKAANYDSILRKIAKKVGVKHFSSHIARKSRATHLLNEGRNENAIKLLLGHSPNSTTIFQYYAHPDIEILKDLYE